MTSKTPPIAGAGGQTDARRRVARPLWLPWVRSIALVLVLTGSSRSRATSFLPSDLQTIVEHADHVLVGRVVRIAGVASPEADGATPDHQGALVEGHVQIEDAWLASPGRILVYEALPGDCQEEARLSGDAKEMVPDACLNERVVLFLEGDPTAERLRSVVRPMRISSDADGDWASVYYRELYLDQRQLESVQGHPRVPGLRRVRVPELRRCVRSLAGLAGAVDDPCRGAMRGPHVECLVRVAMRSLQLMPLSRVSATDEVRVSLFSRSGVHVVRVFDSKTGGMMGQAWSLSPDHAKPHQWTVELDDHWCGEWIGPLRYRSVEVTTKRDEWDTLFAELAGLAVSEGTDGGDESRFVRGDGLADNFVVLELRRGTRYLRAVFGEEDDPRSIHEQLRRRVMDALE